MYEEQNHQLTQEIHELRDHLSQTDQRLFQANANSDMQLREIQTLQNQLNSANDLIRQYQETNHALSARGGQNDGSRS